MPAAIWESFAERFNVEIFEWYGAIEGGIAFNPVGVGPMGSFGKPPPGLEMKILNENDVECAPGIQGEICSRPLDGSGANVEYHENPEASEKKTRGGWLRSGDIGHTDDEGWFFFDYRKGGGIRHNGDFVNISFIEKAIAEVPSVTDVFIYGVEAASGAPGEKDVVAAIVPTEADSFSVDEVFATCRQALESNFVPTYLQVVDEIPKTASEKPQERFLLADFAVDAANIYTETR
jgi:crotonobetaine/carnitine-CoA ligase